MYISDIKSGIKSWRPLRRLWLFLAVAASVAPWRAAAVSPYGVLQERAERFFSQKEWTQASAVYDLMLDEKPGVAATYGRAIVANGIRGDHKAQVALMQKALDNHVPFDSVFSRVRQSSFELGRTRLYEQFLTQVRNAYPWMKRTIDGYLLRYYAYRKNGEMIDCYSRLMLDGAPGNVEFLTLLGEGCFLQNLPDKAVEAYEAVLAEAPDNYNALVTLGNWYAQCAAGGDAQAVGLARDYLSRAYALYPTPYVAARLARL